MLSEALMQQSQDLDQENIRLWKEISTSQYMFDRPQRCASALAAVTKKEMVAHFEAMFFDTKSCRLDITMASSRHDKDRQ